MMYEALRSFNPSPYMASIGSPEFAVVSGSPELLLKKRGNELSTRPIGGTRPRGKDEQEDAALQAELLSNEKETGEHIMLVDLEKEDFERVCAPGTVETDEFMVVEKYSHVMHLVSNVRGTAAEGMSNADIVKGVFRVVRLQVHRNCARWKLLRNLNRREEAYIQVQSDGSASMAIWN